MRSGTTSPRVRGGRSPVGHRVRLLATTSSICSCCRPATEETFAEAGRIAAEACEPVSDMRGDADYKRHLASELTIRTLRTSVERVRNMPASQGN